jgi:hypothetical protein
MYKETHNLGVESTKTNMLCLDSPCLNVFAPQTDDLFEMLLSALEDKGCSIVRLKYVRKEDDGGCLVYITKGLIHMFSGADVANRRFEQSDFAFIPVISDADEPEQREILSRHFYCFLEKDSIEKYAQRIYFLVLMGEKQWKNWAHIYSLAVDWENARRPKNSLLCKADLSVANQLLKHPIHELLTEQSEIIRDLVAATEKYFNHRRHVMQSIIISIGAVFLPAEYLPSFSKEMRIWLLHSTKRKPR